MHGRALRVLLVNAALLAGGLAALLFVSPAGAAVDRYVDPAGVDSGDCSTIATPCLTIAYAVGQAAAGDIVHLAAGTYTGLGNQHVVIDKALTLSGASPAATFVDYDPAVTSPPSGGRNGILEISAGDVTVRDLALRNAPTEGGVTLWAVRVWKTNGTLANVTFDTVHFLNNAGRGIELHAQTTVADMVITDCLFEGNGDYGLRLSSTAVVNGLNVTGTTFRDNGEAGLYQSTGVSYLTGLHVAGSTFQDNGQNGIVLGHAYDAIIENSTFSGGNRGLAFVNSTATANPVGDVTIRGNTLSDFGGAAVLIDITNNALDEPLTIENNTITQDAADLMALAAAIDIGLTAAETHAAVDVIDNDVTFSGVPGAATGAYGVKVSGGASKVTLDGNALDGGGIGNNGAEPPTSGLVIASTSAKFGPLADTDEIEATTNEITGFVNGVSVYDEVGAAYGGLPAANGVNILRNSIAGNSDYGVQSGPANATAAFCNWWGAADGPGGVGPGGGDDVSSDVVFAPWLASDDLGASLCGSVNDIFVGTNKGGKVGGVPFSGVDVLALDRDTGTWSMFFDGNDVGVSTNLTGFTFEPGGCLLVSFDGNEKKLGVGFIKPQDVLKFCPTSLGDVTAGTWSVYMDGSDVNLKKVGENLDALERLPDGRLLLSTKGDFSVKTAANATLNGRDEDILVFDPTTTGPNTTGSFEMYLDGSTIPGLATEDVTGIYYNPLNGDLHITIQGTFTVGGVSGDSNDIIILRPNGGGYTVLPYWNGTDDGWNYVLRSMHVDLP